MTQTATPRKQSQITAPAVFRCTDKVTGEVLGYAVPSNSTEDTRHVTYNYQLHRYECDCICGEKYHHTVECMHIRAVKELLALRRELAIEALAEWMSGFAATLQAQAMPLAGYDIQAEVDRVVDALDYEADPRKSDFVNAIRNGQLVEVRWSELTEDERRAARERMYDYNNVA